MVDDHRVARQCELAGSVRVFCVRDAPDVFRAPRQAAGRVFEQEPRGPGLLRLHFPPQLRFGTGQVGRVEHAEAVEFADDLVAPVRQRQGHAVADGHEDPVVGLARTARSVVHGDAAAGGACEHFLRARERCNEALRADAHPGRGRAQRCRRDIDAHGKLADRDAVGAGLQLEAQVALDQGVAGLAAALARGEDVVVAAVDGEPGVARRCLLLVAGFGGRGGRGGSRGGRIAVVRGACTQQEGGNRAGKRKRRRRLLHRAGLRRDLPAIIGRCE